MMNLYPSPVFAIETCAPFVVTNATTTHSDISTPSFRSMVSSTVSPGYRTVSLTLTVPIWDSAQCMVYSFRKVGITFTLPPGIVKVKSPSRLETGILVAPCQTISSSSSYSAAGNIITVTVSPQAALTGPITWPVSVMLYVMVDVLPIIRNVFIAVTPPAEMLAEPSPGAVLPVYEIVGWLPYQLSKQATSPGVTALPVNSTLSGTISVAVAKWSQPSCRHVWVRTPPAAE